MTLWLLHLVALGLIAALLIEAAARRPRGQLLVFVLFFLPFAAAAVWPHFNDDFTPAGFETFPQLLLQVPLFGVLFPLVLALLAWGLAEGALCRLSPGQAPPASALPVLCYWSAMALAYPLEATAQAAGLWSWAPDVDQYFPRLIIEVPDIALGDWSYYVGTFFLAFTPACLGAATLGRWPAAWRLFALAAFVVLLPITIVFNAHSDAVPFYFLFVGLIHLLPFLSLGRLEPPTMTAWPASRRFAVLAAAVLLCLAVVQVVVLGRPDLLVSDGAWLLLLLLGVPAVRWSWLGALACGLVLASLLLWDLRVGFPLALVVTPLFWLFGARRLSER